MIYFLRAGDHVKIGWTKDNATLKTRICSLQTGQPNKIEVIRTLDAERWTETWLHGFFSGARMAGEWFAFDQKMLIVEPPESNPKTKKKSFELPAGHLTDKDLIAELRSACAQAGGQKAWAAMHGISPQYVNDLVNGRRPPSPNVAGKLGYVPDWAPIKPDQAPEQAA